MMSPTFWGTSLTERCQIIGILCYFLSVAVCISILVVTIGGGSLLLAVVLVTSFNAVLTLDEGRKKWRMEGVDVDEDLD